MRDNNLDADLQLDIPFNETPADDAKAWKAYIKHKSHEFSISEQDVLRIIVFCFDSKIHDYLLHKKYGLLLDNLDNYELTKAIRRTVKKLPQLDHLIKLRRQVSEQDMDFMLSGDGSSSDIGPSDISYI